MAGKYWNLFPSWLATLPEGAEEVRLHGFKAVTQLGFLNRQRVEGTDTTQHGDQAPSPVGEDAKGAVILRHLSSTVSGV